MPPLEEAYDEDVETYAIEGETLVIRLLSAQIK